MCNEQRRNDASQREETIGWPRHVWVARGGARSTRRSAGVCAYGRRMREPMIVGIYTNSSKREKSRRMRGSKKRGRERTHKENKRRRSIVGIGGWMRRKKGSLVCMCVCV